MLTKSNSFFNRVSCICVVSLVFSLNSCKKSEDPSPQERMRNHLLKKTWTLSTTTISGQPTHMFDGMTITFTEDTYMTTNGGVVWPATDTWSFTDDTGINVMRGDGIEVELCECNLVDGNLMLSLSWDESTFTGGKINSVGGQHIFMFE